MSGSPETMKWTEWQTEHFLYGRGESIM